MVKPTEPTRTAACMITEGGRTYCIDPLEGTAQLLSKRWALLIIGAVGNQPQVRFSEVKRMIPGISSRALSDVLARLQADGLVLRDVDGTRSPPAVGYGLTGRGHSLRRALIPLLEWAEDGAPT